MRINDAGQGEMFGFDQPITRDEVLDLFHKYPGKYTRRMIAVALGRAKSPSLIAMLHTLCDEGVLTWEYYTLPNHVDMYLYSLKAPLDTSTEELAQLYS